MELIEKTIERMIALQPDEGYYGAFSGGKDSQVLYHIAQMAGVKVDWHFHRTSIDPPQLLRFIRHNYRDVIWHKPQYTMYQLIIRQKMLPTRLIRYCCRILKEHGGTGRVVMVGVRASESVRRSRYTMVAACQTMRCHIIRPILDWTRGDVWQFLNDNNISHCVLYDYPYKFQRIGCIGCPMAPAKQIQRQFRFFPNHRRAYLNTIARLMELGVFSDFADPEAVLRWWIGRESKKIFFEAERQEAFCFD